MCLYVLHSVRLLPSISSFSFTVRHHTISSSHRAVKWAIGRRVVVFASSLDCGLVVTSFSLYLNISIGMRNKEMNCYDWILGIQIRATFIVKTFDEIVLTSTSFQSNSNRAKAKLFRPYFMRAHTRKKRKGNYTCRVASITSIRMIGNRIIKIVMTNHEAVRVVI